MACPKCHDTYYLLFLTLILFNFLPIVTHRNLSYHTFCIVTRAHAATIDASVPDLSRSKPPLQLFAANVEETVTAVAAAQQYAALGGGGSSELRSRLLAAMASASNPSPSSLRSLILNAEPFVQDGNNAREHPTQLALGLQIASENWLDMTNMTTTTASPTTTTTPTNTASISSTAPTNTSIASARRASWNLDATNIRIEALMASVPAYLDPYGLDTWIKEVLSQREEVDESSGLPATAESGSAGGIGALTTLRYITLSLAGVKSDDPLNFSSTPTLLLDMSAAATFAGASSLPTSSTPTVNDNKCFAPTMDSYLLLKLLVPPSVLVGADVTTDGSSTMSTQAGIVTASSTSFSTNTGINVTTQATFSTLPSTTTTTNPTSSAYSEYRSFHTRLLYTSGERRTQTSAFTHGVPTALLTNTIPINFLAYGSNDSLEMNAVTGVTIVIAGIALCLFAFFNAQFEALLIMWQLQTLMMFAFSSCAPRSVARVFGDVTWLVWPVNAFGFYSKYNPLLLSSEMLLHAATFIGVVAVVLIFNFVFANVVLHYSRKSTATAATSATPFGEYLADLGGIGDLLTGRVDYPSSVGHHSDGGGSHVSPHGTRARGRSQFNKNGLAVPMLHREGSHDNAGGDMEMYSPHNRSFGRQSALQSVDARDSTQGDQPVTYADDDLFFDSTDEEDEQAGVFHDLRVGRKALSDPTANLTPYARARFPSIFLLCSFLLLPGAVYSASKTLSLASNMAEHELPYTKSSSADTVYAGKSDSESYAPYAAATTPSLSAFTIRDRLMLSDSNYGPGYWLVPQWALILVGAFVLLLGFALLYAAFMIIMRVVTRENFRRDYSYSLPTLGSGGQLTLHDMLLLKRSGDWVSVDSQYKYGLFYDGLDGSSFWFQFPYIVEVFVVATVAGQMPLSPQGCTGNAYIHLIATTAIALLVTIRRPYICLSFNILNILVSLVLFFYSIGAVVSTSCGSRGQTFTWTMLWLCLLVLLVKAVFVFIAFAIWAYKRHQSQTNRRHTKQKGDESKGVEGQKHFTRAEHPTNLGAFVLPSTALTGDDRDLDLLPDVLDPFIINPSQFSRGSDAMGEDETDDAIIRAKFRPLLTRQIPPRPSVLDPFGSIAVPFMDPGCHHSKTSTTTKNRKHLIGTKPLDSTLTYLMLLSPATSKKSLLRLVEALVRGDLFDMTYMSSAMAVSFRKAMERRPFGDIDDHHLIEWLQGIHSALGGALSQKQLLFAHHNPSGLVREGYRNDLASIHAETMDSGHAIDNTLSFGRNGHITSLLPQLVEDVRGAVGPSILFTRSTSPYLVEGSAPTILLQSIIEAWEEMSRRTIGLLIATVSLRKICGFGPRMHQLESNTVAAGDGGDNAMTIRLNQPSGIAVSHLLPSASSPPLLIADRVQCRILSREGSQDDDASVKIHTVAARGAMEEAITSVAPYSIRLNVTGPIVVPKNLSPLNLEKEDLDPIPTTAKPSTHSEVLIVDSSLKTIGTVPPVTVHNVCCRGSVAYFTSNAGLFRCDLNNSRIKQNTVVCLAAVLGGGGPMTETVKKGESSAAATRTKILKRLQGEAIDDRLEEEEDHLFSERHISFKDEGDSVLQGFIKDNPTPLLQHPHGLCVHEATGTLFVADPKAGAVFAVNMGVPVSNVKVCASKMHTKTHFDADHKKAGVHQGANHRPTTSFRTAESIFVDMAPLGIAISGSRYLRQYFGQMPPTPLELLEDDNRRDFYRHSDNSAATEAQSLASRILERRYHDYTQPQTQVNRSECPSYSDLIRSPSAVCLCESRDELFVADTDAHVVWCVPLRQRSDHGGKFSELRLDTTSRSASGQRDSMIVASSSSAHPSHLAGMLFPSYPQIHIAAGVPGKDSDIHRLEDEPQSQFPDVPNSATPADHSRRAPSEGETSPKRKGNKAQIEALRRQLGEISPVHPNSSKESPHSVDKESSLCARKVAPPTTLVRGYSAPHSLLCFPTDVAYVESSHSLIIVDCGHQGTPSAEAVANKVSSKKAKDSEHDLQELRRIHCGRVWVVDRSASDGTATGRGVARLLLPPTLISGTKDGYLVPRHVALLSHGGYLPNCVPNLMRRSYEREHADENGSTYHAEQPLSIWTNAKADYTCEVAMYGPERSNEEEPTPPALRIALSDPYNDVVIELAVRLTPCAQQLGELGRRTLNLQNNLLIKESDETRHPEPLALQPPSLDAVKESEIDNYDIVIDEGDVIASHIHKRMQIISELRGRSLPPPIEREVDPQYEAIIHMDPKGSNNDILHSDWHLLENRAEDKAVTTHKGRFSVPLGDANNNNLLAPVPEDLDLDDVFQHIQNRRALLRHSRGGVQDTHHSQL